MKYIGWVLEVPLLTYNFTSTFLWSILDSADIFILRCIICVAIYNSVPELDFPIYSSEAEPVDPKMTHPRCIERPKKVKPSSKSIAGPKTLNLLPEGLCWIFLPIRGSRFLAFQIPEAPALR